MFIEIPYAELLPHLPGRRFYCRAWLNEDMQIICRVPLTGAEYTHPFRYSDRQEAVRRAANQLLLMRPTIEQVEGHKLMQ